jgi:hypothetical protein
MATPVLWESLSVPPYDSACYVLHGGAGHRIGRPAGRHHPQLLRLADRRTAVGRIRPEPASRCYTYGYGRAPLSAGEVGMRPVGHRPWGRSPGCSPRLPDAGGSPPVRTGVGTGRWPASISSPSLAGPGTRDRRRWHGSVRNTVSQSIVSVRSDVSALHTPRPWTATYETLDIDLRGAWPVDVLAPCRPLCKAIAP